MKTGNQGMRAGFVAISAGLLVVLVTSNVWAQQGKGPRPVPWLVDVEVTGQYAIALDSEWPHLAPGIGIAVDAGIDARQSVRFFARAFTGHTDTNICLTDVGVEDDCDARYYDAGLGLRIHRGSTVPFYIDLYVFGGREERVSTDGRDARTSDIIGGGTRLGFVFPIATWFEIRPALSVQIASSGQVAEHGADDRIWCALEVAAAATF